MRNILIPLFAALLAAAPAWAAPEIGKTAPRFDVQDIEGNSVSSDKLKGKIVVLEWTNPTCPFVRKHYESHNMQDLQAEAVKKNVIWITVNSGSEGKVGSLNKTEALEQLQTSEATPTHYVLDPEGKLGHLYGAKTTPHMFIIDPKGKIAYMGAIDDDTSTNPAKIGTARNYVREALTEVLAGKPVKTASTQSYGCSVKYAD